MDVWYPGHNACEDSQAFVFVDIEIEEQMMTYRTRIMGAALAAALAGACGPTTSSQFEPNAFAATEERSTMIVDNDNWADVALYMVRGGVRMRIATVRGMSEERLTLAPAMLGPGGTIVIQADPVGSRFGFQSEPLVVIPGQTIHVQLGSNLGMSQAFVR